jgi:hypothetical protein
MKSFAVLSLLGLAISTQVMDDKRQSELRRGRFGAMEAIEYTETGSNKVVMKPFKRYHEDYIQQA